jgi:hypothetical protein
VADGPGCFSNDPMNHGYDGVGDMLIKGIRSGEYSRMSVLDFDVQEQCILCRKVDSGV